MAIFSASHRSPMPDTLRLTHPGFRPDPAPLMQALSHSSTCTSVLKTLHPPVTYRAALMPTRRPARPFPSFSMMLHNKPATDYKIHPKISWEKPQGSHIQEPHKGFCMEHAQDPERPLGLWRRKGHSSRKATLVSGFLNSLSIISKHKLTVLWK